MEDTQTPAETGSPRRYTKESGQFYKNYQDAHEAMERAKKTMESFGDAVRFRVRKRNYPRVRFELVTYRLLKKAE